MFYVPDHTSVVASDRQWRLRRQARDSRVAELADGLNA